ncbi:MAG TPA: VanZ family protein [Bacteroidales bacterium]|nr:VanZ family protein [Bacteroidales bacterium]
MIQLIIWIKPFARYVLIAWIITMITVSSIPSLPTLKIHTERCDIRLDYLIHFCEYGLLAFITYLSFTGKEFKMNMKKYLSLTIALIAFAVLDEYHQKLIPGRSFNVKDIQSNIIGIITALGFCIYLFRLIASRLAKRDLKSHQ